jgi:predicted signal transduction protein with EAL and GGDEF domain
VHELGLRPESIVLEITERVAIQEWNKFKKVIHEFRNYGFKVAIDDMGAGYSSLQAIAELEPDFLKFDISLVRNIHENLIKLGILETLVALSAKINAQVIAEGVEEIEEYRTSGNEEEIADVYEVMDCLVQFKEYEPMHIDYLRLIRKEARGSYKERVLLIDVEAADE